MSSITINEHSSIRVEREDGTVLYFDPYNIQGAPADADAVFITHTHYDHYDPDSIQAVRKPDTVFVAPYELAMQLREAGEPAERCIGVMPRGKVEVLGMPVLAVPAYNEVQPFHRGTSMWVGYVVELDGQRLYVCGDTDATLEAHAVECDIICVPVGGKYTMDAAEAAALVNSMEPRPQLAVPTHYGTVVGSPRDGERFASLVEPPTRVQLLL